MANYLIKHTDPANGSFLVPDNQIDGTQQPWSAALYVNPVSSVTALSSNSSIVIPGRGITDYGELLANGVIQAMEHFAYKTRPLTPAQGQIWYKNANFVDVSFPLDPTLAGLYVWNGTTWDPILSAIGGIVNMAGAVITNLGNATNPTDALNLQTGDSRYVNVSGDTMTGLLVLSGDPVAALGAATMQYVDNTTVATAGDTMTGLLVLSGDPVAALGAATKQYVDNTTVSITGDTMTAGFLTLFQDPTLAMHATTKQYVDNTTVSVTGDTMTGTLLIDLNADLTMAGGGTGIFNGGTRRLQNIGNPTANQDAATKFYVDAAIAGFVPPPAVDTYVTSGSYDPLTGVLDLTRNDAVVITVTGNMAPFVHSHTTSNITYDLSTNYGQSVLRSTEQYTPGYPVIPLYNVLRTMDQTVADLTREVRRTLFTGDGTTASFDAGPYSTFSANENRLQVFIDGVKQYVNERGRSSVVFENTPISLDTLTGLVGIYTFDITVDGTPFTGVTLNATTTAINSLYNLIGGSGYTTPGTYLNVPLTGGTGTGATANITVFGGSVIDVVLVLRGTGYTAGDTLSAADATIGGRTGGSAFTTQVQTLSGPYSFFDLIVDLQSIFTDAGIPVTMGFDQYFERLIFHFDSATTGTGSSVTVSSAAAELFTFPAPPITTQVAAPINTAITQSLSYFESLSAADVPASSEVSEITFNTPPANGTIIEMLVFPG
jgi:hypothetical protein